MGPYSPYELDPQCTARFREARAKFAQQAVLADFCNAALRAMSSAVSPSMSPSVSGAVTLPVPLPPLPVPLPITATSGATTTAATTASEDSSVHGGGLGLGGSGGLGLDPRRVRRAEPRLRPWVRSAVGFAAGLAQPNNMRDLFEDLNTDVLDGLDGMGFSAPHDVELLFGALERAASSGVVDETLAEAWRDVASGLKPLLVRTIEARGGGGLVAVLADDD